MCVCVCVYMTRKTHELPKRQNENDWTAVLKGVGGNIITIPKLHYIVENDEKNENS